MNSVLIIAKDEWRYWLRSNLAIYSSLLFALLLIATSIITIVQIQSKAAHLSQDQVQAEATFVDQPDRHPHRMVHYGHYVFRTPMPLSLFDPGLDAVTGQAIFLEGHRQNTATFSESAASAELGGLAWLTPAMVYQIFAPLLIVLLGHGAITREREAATLIPLVAQGLSGKRLIWGKALALLGATGVLLAPMVVAMILALLAGAKLMAVLSLLAMYFLYLCVWCWLTLLVSAVMAQRATGLATLATAWLVFTLVLPAVLVNWVAKQEPIPGKIATDLEMIVDTRKLGDGHNANDPAFDQLKSGLLQQYQVTSVEDLPVNLRGIVARQAEEKLTHVLNQYAQRQADGEIRQAQLLQQYSWLSPTMALGFASRALSATDLYHYHLFLQAAEKLRFDFVQGLNQVHVEKLSYYDDIRRNGSEEQGKRARVDAANWSILEEFRMAPAPTGTRLINASSTLWILLVWMLALACVTTIKAGRIQQ